VGRIISSGDSIFCSCESHHNPFLSIVRPSVIRGGISILASEAVVADRSQPSLYQSLTFLTSRHLDRHLTVTNNSLANAKSTSTLIK